MRWLKRDRWKAGIALTGMLLFLTLMVEAPGSAGAYEGASGLATPTTVTVQGMPTVDATVIALNKEKLAQEVQQLKNQNDHSLAAWFWNSGGLLGTVVAALLAIAGVLTTIRFNAYKERIDRTEAQNKDLKDKTEERFKTAITALGGEEEGMQLGGALLLRSFLDKDDKEIYERYYTQIFDLAVAYLRPSNPPIDPNAPLPLTSLCQALSILLKDTFPLVRYRLGSKTSAMGHSLPLQSRNASGIRLDHAYFAEADLGQVWMPGAFLRNTNFNGANLSGANLIAANLQETRLRSANLSGADLCSANLVHAKLSEANLRKANLSQEPREESILQLSGTSQHTEELISSFKGADLSGADLSGADLSDANLSGAGLSRTNLQLAKVNGADLTDARFIKSNLKGVKLEDALSLKQTFLFRAEGLTKEQLAACEAKGAIIHYTSTTSACLNFALVIDHSNSIRGEELKIIKETVKLIIDILGPTDYISIIIFNDTAQIVIPSMPANDPDGMKAAIDRIQNAGGKKISLGMSQGLDELRRWKIPDAIHRMILFTDGKTYDEADICRQLARDAAISSISICPLGIGSDQYSTILDEIGHLSGGMPAKFIRTPADAMGIFE